MISRLNWFIGAIFFSAAFGVLIPPGYTAIALLFLGISIAFLPGIIGLSRSNENWQIEGGAKRVIILASLLLICLVMPQVETNMAAFTSPIEDLKNSSYFS